MKAAGPVSLPGRWSDGAEGTSIRQETKAGPAVCGPCSSWPQSPFCAPHCPLPWPEASSWPLQICPLAVLELTLSLQPSHFDVLAKVAVTHTQMCRLVGGWEGAHIRQPVTATQLGQLESLRATLGEVPVPR